MIEIEILKKGMVVKTGRATKPETAVPKARILWNEALRGIQGEIKDMMTRYYVDGKMVRQIEGRRP